MPTIKVDTVNNQAVELYFEVSGEGKPVLLIHGWPLSGRAWESQVPALVEAGYQVIAYDRRGFGKSSQPYTGYDYDTLAQDVKVLIEALDLQSVTLVGFSMGGGEVARYLGNYGSERIAKAVFASAVPPYLYKTDDNPDGGLDDATINEFLNGVRDDRLAFLDDFTKNFFTADNECLVSEHSRLYHQQLAAFASPQGTYECIKSFSYSDFRDDLKKIDVPTLVIHGDSDNIVPFEVSGERTVEMVKSSKLHIIKGGPHGISATHPEEFNQALIQFLNE